MTKIICVAGFGDDASMFTPLVKAANTESITFHPISLPGFGAPALGAGNTSLASLATSLIECAEKIGASTVLAHSVASIIATMAADQPNSPVSTILSLEGNLTPEDAYFSGTAAQFESADMFRKSFLNRLTEMAKDDLVIERYFSVVSRADPQALWELGCDAYRFSQAHSPGAWLQRVPRAAYLYNPANLPESSLAWLSENTLPRFKLAGASHWASFDQPQLLAQRIMEALDG